MKENWCVIQALNGEFNGRFYCIENQGHVRVVPYYKILCENVTKEHAKTICEALRTKKLELE